MKQVININYHGRIIPIETDAHDLLKAYISTLQTHFQDEQGREEIINDIESRISELFQEQLNKGSVCISENHVNAVIRSMGRPEEFETESNILQNTQTNRPETNPSNTPRRLYRDENNKLLGGVCSGLANYFNIDIVVVRIIFLVLFFSFGAGLVSYLILWVVVPSSANTVLGSLRKKLYRDPDEKVIAGVCSGLAHYFGISVWIPRLVFSLSFLTFTFRWYSLMNIAPGLSVIYLIFWLVVPEAKTTSEKLEMKGEKVDMNSIQQAINEEMKGVKERAENLGKDARVKAKEIGSGFSNVLKRVINAIVGVVVFIVKAVSYTTLTLIGIALFLTLLCVGALSFLVFPFKEFVLNGTWQHVFAFGTLLFFVILAIVAIIVWVIKKIAGIKTKNKWVTVTFIALWILGWISLFGLISTLGNDFSRVSHRDNNEKEITIKQPANGKLVVAFNKHPYFLDEDDKNINFFEALDLLRDSVFIENVDIKVLRSLDDSFHVRMVNSAHGRTRFSADTTAAAIKIGVSQTDSIITIDRGLFINKKQKFRNQQVAVLISVPEGKRISIPKSGFTANYEDESWEFRSWHDNKQPNQEFQMTNEGLKPLEKLDKIDDKINDRLNELDKLDKLQKLRLLDSLIQLEKKTDIKQSNGIKLII